MTITRHWKPASNEPRNFTCQAGRADKTKMEDEPWGTTSSQSHFKAYEASEARNARSLPAQLLLSQEPAAPPGPRPLQVWERHREDYPDLSAAPGSGTGAKYIPAAELVHMRPIPPRDFSAVSHYKQHHEDAQQARHDYFPYRDEFHPRSKRLLHEMALNAHSQNLERGSVASDDTRSVFTLPSTTVSRKSGSKASSRGASSAARSLSSSRLPTGDSLRVGGGRPGQLAKRRAEAFFRSPSQSQFDRNWYLNVMDKEGPAALQSSNYTARMYNGSLDKYGQALAEMSALLSGTRETQPRERTNK